MSSPGSVAGDERLRLFLALQLPDVVVEALVELATAGAAPAASCRRPTCTSRSRSSAPGLHGELESICAVLGEAAGEAAPPRLRRSSATARRAASACSSSPTRPATALCSPAGSTSELAELGVYEPERRTWLPHVTVLRFRERPRLQPPLPELGAFAPSGAAAFLSRLHPSGAVYEVLESFPLNRRRAGG